ncbi:MAG: aldo/keto reductase [Candidatus Margulisbacteria bacterium]|nr:aldo/keto reductase [Candidatus Margulisiibacteriota bacterium]MBU1617127.1 aldo/keto reductase [Candidatus Margulisiibacteriota bacterium]
MNKIALGTAQFGMDYGINNLRGKIPSKEAFAILDEAARSGIDTLDTATAYGESENILGEFLKLNKNKYRVVSKLPGELLTDLKEIVNASLEKLNIGSFYGYLFHNINTYKEAPLRLELLKELKKEGKINKIGFSLYYPADLDLILDNDLECDLVQVPYSVFDRRFEPYFRRLKDRQIELHVRSVFLQGLLFKPASELGGYFLPVKGKIAALRRLAEESSIPLPSMLLNFALANSSVDRVVVGVDGLDNLRELVASARYLNEFSRIKDRLDGLKEDDEKILLPFNWKAAVAG